jgi:hypothetical protein
MRSAAVGIFSKFKEFKENKAKSQAEKFGETLKTVMTTKENRLEAIEALSDLSPEIAVPQLIKRYDLVIDHAIQDTREKEMVSNILLKNQEIAKPFVKEKLSNTRHIGWLIKLTERLFTKEEFTNLLIENLNTDIAHFDEIQTDRNIELLLALKEIQDQRIVEKTLPFVSSRNDSLKLAAIDCLESQSESSAEAKNAIIAISKEPPTDDNSRMLGLVKSIIQKHNWA